MSYFERLIESDAKTIGRASFKKLSKDTFLGFWQWKNPLVIKDNLKEINGIKLNFISNGATYNKINVNTDANGAIRHFSWGTTMVYNNTTELGGTIGWVGQEYRTMQILDTYDDVVKNNSEEVANALKTVLNSYAQRL
jgi:hypothetical protein